MDERPNQPLFRRFYVAEVRQLASGQLGPPLDRGFPDLRANHLFCNTGFVGQTITELVARRGVGNARRHRQHGGEKLTAPFIII